MTEDGGRPEDPFGPPRFVAQWRALSTAEKVITVVAVAVVLASLVLVWLPVSVDVDGGRFACGPALAPHTIDPAEPAAATCQEAVSDRLLVAGVAVVAGTVLALAGRPLSRRLQRGGSSSIRRR